MRIARRPRPLGGRPEIHLGSGPDARVERSVTRARRMSRPAKAGATDEVRPRAMRAGRVPHGSRAWYCPFTLASGSDPRHESRVALQPPAIARSLQNFHLNHFRLIARSTIGTAAATTLRSGFSDRATPSMVTIVLIRSVEEGGT